VYASECHAGFPVRKMVRRFRCSTCYQWPSSAPVG